MEKNAEWNADFAGHPAAHCCAYTSARDLATLGDWVLKQYNNQGAGRRGRLDPRLHDRHRRCDMGLRLPGHEAQLPLRLSMVGPLRRPARRIHRASARRGSTCTSSRSRTSSSRSFGEKLASDADTCEAMLVHRLIADSLSRP